MSAHRVVTLPVKPAGYRCVTAAVAGKLKTSLNRTQGIACSLDGHAAFRRNFQKLPVIRRDNGANVVLCSSARIAHDGIGLDQPRSLVSPDRGDDGLLSVQSGSKNDFTAP